MGDRDIKTVPTGVVTPPQAPAPVQGGPPVAAVAQGSTGTPRDAAALSRSILAEKGQVPKDQVSFAVPQAGSSDQQPSRYFMRVGAGLHVNKYGKTDLHIVVPANGIDVTLHGVQAVQRTSFSYLYNWPSGYPQFDETQSSVKVAFGDRKTNWGAEIGLDHHKYVVNNWDKQVVHATGTLGGKPVDGDVALKDIGWMYEHTDGLNRISAKAVKSFNLPAFKGDAFKYNAKLGPDAFLLFTKAHIYDQHGGTDETYGPYHMGGYGATLENSLEYDFKNKAYLEIFHALTYANLPNVKLTNGHADQSFWISQFGFTVGRYFNFKPKHKPPAAAT